MRKSEGKRGSVSNVLKNVDFDRDVFTVLKGKGEQLDWQVKEVRLREVMVDMMEP